MATLGICCQCQFRLPEGGRQPSFQTFFLFPYFKFLMKQFLICAHFKGLYSKNIKYSIRDESIKKMFLTNHFYNRSKRNFYNPTTIRCGFFKYQWASRSHKRCERGKYIILPLEILFYTFYGVGVIRSGGGAMKG